MTLISRPNCYWATLSPGDLQWNPCLSPCLSTWTVITWSGLQAATVEHMQAELTKELWRASWEAQESERQERTETQERETGSLGKGVRSFYGLPECFQSVTELSFVHFDPISALFNNTNFYLNLQGWELVFTAKSLLKLQRWRGKGKVSWDR